MKTSNQTFVIILFIGLISLFLFKICNTKPPGECAEYVEDCNELKGESQVIPDELIFYKQDTNFLFTYPIDTLDSTQNPIAMHPDIRRILFAADSILKSIGKDTLIRQYCPCDSSIVLVKKTEPTNINLDSLFAQAETDIDDENRGKNRTVPFNSSLSTPIPLPKKKDNKDNKDLVLVGLVDSGIDFTQKGLDNYFWTNPGIFEPTSTPYLECSDTLGYDFGSGGGRPQDNLGHGSHIAGIISIGIDGIIQQNQPNFQIIPAKITDDSGDITLFSALCGTKYVINNGAKIVNLSWGYYKEDYDSILYRIMKDGEKDSVLFVTSAGNNTMNTDCCHHWPSNFASHPELNNVISVAALNKDNSALASYSNYGPQTVTLAATGTDINSFWVYDKCQVEKGTSMAAGFVTRNALKQQLTSPIALPRDLKAHIINDNAVNFPESRLINQKKIVDFVDCD